VVFDLGGGDQVLLEDTLLASLTTDDFIV